MKKTTTLIIALAMLFGMSQCKKNVKPVATPSDLGEAVHITLYIGGDDGKHIVHTSTGAVDYTDGDVIYVGNNGKYIGSLVYANDAFSGDIYSPSTDDYLHFYFVGGLTPSETPVAGTTTSFSVDLHDQSSQIPVLSYVRTTGKYAGETTYEYMLFNKCGLVKFNLANTDIPASTDVAVMGMNNGATVHFDGEPFTYSTNGDGTVILNAVSAQERWAVLPVQDEVNTAVAMADEGHSFSETFTVPAITANMYYPEGVDIPAMAVASKALTFAAKTAGATVKLKLANGVSMEYSTDGDTWGSYTSEAIITLTSVGDKVMFRAPSAGNATMCTTFNPSDITQSDASYFINTGDCYVYGNVMSLLYQDFDGKTTFATGSIANFAGLFNSNDALYNHPTKSIELPATTLNQVCYAYMFSGSDNITTAPALPATTLAAGCYFSMFQSCEGLTKAPALPAMILAESCYAMMFAKCTSLTTAPWLPATTLAKSCYTMMFRQCTSLATAPELPAMTLTKECYEFMLAGCTSLTEAPELPATTLAENCYAYMFAGSGLTATPALPAMELAEECYQLMFWACDNLETVTELPATTLAKKCYWNMFDDCPSLVNVPEILPATSLAEECYYGMFSSCPELTKAPVLPAETLVTNCYVSMFSGCTKLSSVTCLATNPNTTDCSRWLTEVASTGTFTKATGVTWPTDTADGIPTGWHVQDYRASKNNK